MGIFSSNVKVGKSGILKGFSDHHCHILPGVDDGFKTVEDSLEALALYEQAGIREVWLTPHIMEDIPNLTAELKARFGELKAAYKGGLHLHLAAENMLDSLFDERLASGDLLPMPGRHLLVETSYFNPPAGFHQILAGIKSKGYFPLLAHPERYMYMDMDEYRRLRSEDVRFQLNLTSVTGHYGPEVRDKALRLLKEGMYDLSGTDLHRLSTFEHLLDSSLPKKSAAAIRDLPLKNL